MVGSKYKFCPILVFKLWNIFFINYYQIPENFIREVTGNQEILIERMWRFLGYIFTQSLDAKAFFVMGCAPNSGKSLLGKFIMKLYEPQYVSSIALSDFNGGLHCRGKAALSRFCLMPDSRSH